MKLSLWEKLNYYLAVIFSLGSVFLVKVIIKKAIIEAKEEK